MSKLISFVPLHLIATIKVVLKKIAQEINTSFAFSRLFLLINRSFLDFLKEKNCEINYANKLCCGSFSSFSE